jgi:MSHA pilin protein MshA
MTINTTNTHNNKRNKGFTMIELIIVIVILGILSVTALPKFLNLSADAKSATLESVAGAMQSALKVVHAKAIIAGKDKGDNAIDINGVNIALYNGYPAIDGTDSVSDMNKHLKAWLEIDSVDSNTANNSDNQSPFFTAKSTLKNRLFIFLSSDRSQMRGGFECQIRYTNPVTATPTPPVILVLTNSC